MGYIVRLSFSREGNSGLHSTPSNYRPIIQVFYGRVGTWKSSHFYTRRVLVGLLWEAISNQAVLVPGKKYSKIRKHDFVWQVVLRTLRGDHPINALVADSHDGFKSLILPGWFMCIHAPGPLSFVCLLIRPRPGTYCHSPLLHRFGFVLSSGCSALGLPAGKRLVVWVGFVPSSPRSDRSDTHTPDPPLLTARVVRAFLRFLHLLPRFGSRNLFWVFPPMLSWLRAGSSISSGPLGACQRTWILRPPLWPLGWFWCGVRRHGGIGSIPGLVGSACSHCNCVFLLPDWVLLSRVGFLCGGGYARWHLGCGSDYFFGMCGVALSRHDECSVDLASWVIVNGRQLGYWVGCLSFFFPPNG